MPGWVGGATKQFETLRRTSGFLGPIHDFGCHSEGPHSALPAGRNELFVAGTGADGHR